MSESQSDAGNRDFSSLEFHTYADDERASVTAIASPQTVGAASCGEPGLSTGFSADSTGGITWQLDLNERNLHSFKTNVQRGNAPLRTDFVDSRDFTAACAAEKHDSTDRTETSVCSEGNVTDRKTKSNQTMNDHLDANYSPFSQPKSHRSAAVSSNPMSENDDEGTDANNPLNVNNLKRHVKILSSGIPAVLRPENIGVFDAKKKNEFQYTNSLLVEPPSDSSVHEGSRGNQWHSNLHFVPDTDQWSTQSVGERGHFSDFISESNLRSLSKDNLLQLKRELESDFIPLRPELLAGLENAVKAITGPQSEKPSLFVACSNHREAEEGAREIIDTDQVMELKSDAAQDLEQGTAGMSFHSMMVEAPPTEFRGRVEDHGSLQGSNSENLTLHQQDNHSDEAIPEEDEGKSDSEDSREEYYSSNITDNEEQMDMEAKHHEPKRFPTSTRPDALMSRDLLERNSRSLQELQKTTILSMQQLCDRLEKLERSIGNVVELQKSRHATYEEVVSKSPTTICVGVRVALPPSGAENTGNGARCGQEYLFPFLPSLTILECKEIVLKRLKGIKAVGEETCAGHLYLDGKMLFDEDTLFSLNILSSTVLDMSFTK